MATGWAIDRIGLITTVLGNALAARYLHQTCPRDPFFAYRLFGEVPDWHRHAALLGWRFLSAKVFHEVSRIS